MLLISVVAEFRITSWESMSFIGELGITYGIHNAVQERQIEKQRKERKKEREREITRTKNF
jgi:hypothetical protein